MSVFSFANYLSVVESFTLTMLYCFLTQKCCQWPFLHSFSKNLISQLIYLQNNIRKRTELLTVEMMMLLAAVYGVFCNYLFL